MSRLVKELKILGYELVWVLILIMLGFSLLLFMREQKDMKMIWIFFEIIMPAVACIASSFLLNVESDNALELLAVSPKPIIRIFLLRYVVINSVICFIGFIYMLLLNFFYTNINLLNVLLAFVPTSLMLSSLAVMVSALSNSGVISSLSSMFLWMCDLITKELLKKFYWYKVIYLFGFYENFDFQLLILNKTLLILISVGLWLITYSLLRERERLIRCL